MGTIDEAFKIQFIDTVEDTYLKKLKNKCIGFLGFMCRYLIDQYGKIMTADLKSNNR